MFLFRPIIILSIFVLSSVYAQQININRIEQMPNLPSPYLMRDWKEVAKGYDSLVFNFNLTGDYLPLGKIKTNTVNYPSHNSFILHTVVGTPNTESGEGINCLPAIISASLVGIDKRNQNGNDWVLMTEEWFNNRSGQNVYKNHPVDDSYTDWWYSMMPNVFFYQLYDLYPNTGGFSYQLTAVADQWLSAVYSMGGSDAPWVIPYMNYRGFDLRTMEAYFGNPPEPESAGTIAWLLYNAYSETNQEKYRVGAEMAMEFLSNWESNPSYELQLPYGVYTAARMNAELGTEYDITKMINWCFDIGLLRNWGAILGTWDEIDVHGLIGESINNDYAFSMNTFEQIGALVPLVRYDDRFARAIGKWVLNAANASRLFYPNYLPGFKQDSEQWSYQYDPNSYIAHEGMREEGPGGWSPYATGDAISGGWGATNLSLYSSSHVGILGGIIDTTNITGILKLDLLKTDYFHSDAYPTYLFYNPYNEVRTVNLNILERSRDLYNAVSNSFLETGVSGNVPITILADEAMVIVVVPTGGVLGYDLNRKLVDGIVIDYSSKQIVSNYPPRTKSIGISQDIIAINSSVQLYCTTIDRENNISDYDWIISGGTIEGQGANVIWNTPTNEGTYTISVTVTDDKGDNTDYSISVDVICSINNLPSIQKITAEPRKIDLGESTLLTCSAIDENNDPLAYEWSSISGEIIGDGNTIQWTAPSIKGNYFVTCTVTDGNGGFASDSIQVSVRDLSIIPTGNQICFYPFNGNTNDESGNDYNGINDGAVFVLDRFNSQNSALYFDGIDDKINVTNRTELNFKDAISLNFWMSIEKFYEREQYLISHGNWERRWKVSISNNHLRWTIKTTSGIIDLDSETELITDSLYNITLIYSGTELEIYVNGKLDAFINWSGELAESNVDLTIGQSVPGNINYNFNGILDDIRIYDYALSLDKIKKLFDFSTSIEDENNAAIPNSTRLFQNYPNPFNGQTQISYEVKSSSEINIAIYNLLGQRLINIVDEFKNSGRYSTAWDSKDSNGNQSASGIYFIRLKANNIIDTKKMILLQ